MRIDATLMLAVVAAIGCTSTAHARDQIRIVGSSTVFPYTQAVAEQFVNMTGAAAPVVEATGTGGGMKQFCAGIGDRHPELTGASRAMKSSEYELCRSNGVSDITEALIGYDGLSIAISRGNDHDWDLSFTEIYLALAAEVPVDGEWVENPNRLWSDVRADLPAQEILVYGPPPTSGTRDAFVELAMHSGCESLEFPADKDGDGIDENCSRMRLDGAFVEAGENDNLIVRRLNTDVNAMGIFGYSFLFENLDSLKPISIAGVSPDADTIGDFSYPIARPLYIYIKNDHRGVIPGFQEFIEEYISEDALAPGGYLSERGLVALPDDKRSDLQKAVINGFTMGAM